METLNYIRRKSDGRYVSVDGGFTADRQGKAFVFHEGAAMGIGSFLTPEFDVIPLTQEQAEEFEQRFNEPWSL